MATSPVYTLRTNLKTQIIARLTTDGISGVSVFAYPPGDEAPQTDLIYLEDDDPTQTNLVFGGSREETINLEGVVWVMKPGAGDTVAGAAEQRCLAIAASIENELRDDPTVNSAVFNAEYENGRGTPGVNPDGRTHLKRFTITAEAHL